MRGDLLAQRRRPVPLHLAEERRRSDPAPGSARAPRQAGAGGGAAPIRRPARRSGRRRGVTSSRRGSASDEAGGARVGGRDQRLPSSLHERKQIRAPLGVQLAQDVVQQQDRRAAALIAQKLPLGQQKGQQAEALLALGAEAPQLVATGRQCELVAVRTVRGEPALEVGRRGARASSASSSSASRGLRPAGGRRARRAPAGRAPRPERAKRGASASIALTRAGSSTRMPCRATSRFQPAASPAALLRHARGRASALRCASARSRSGAPLGGRPQRRHHFVEVRAPDAGRALDQLEPVGGEHADEGRVSGSGARSARTPSTRNDLRPTSARSRARSVCSGAVVERHRARRARRDGSDPSHGRSGTNGRDSPGGAPPAGSSCRPDRSLNTVMPGGRSTSARSWLRKFAERQ